MKAINLKTEYLKDPLGIDIEKPRLFWNCEGGLKQTAYRILAEDDCGNRLWDSGRAESSSMAHIAWGGSPVKPRTKVLWKVKLWDENGIEGEWSDTAVFELGLGKNDWSAKWIAGDYVPNKKHRYPVDCFLKEFEIHDKVTKARLYITACGLYEAELGGKKIGDFCLAPGITDYRKRVQYQTYDVTDLLKTGKNSLTVWLADGWYRGSTGAWGLTNQYGTETKFLLQLEMQFENGSKKTIVSDESFKWSNDGPIRFADNKDGEMVEAFRTPSYSGHAKVTSHNVIPTASNNVPLTEKEPFKPVLSKSPNGRIILDFSQNIAGYISFQVKAHKDDKIVIRFGEMLDKNGNLTQKNIQCSSKKKTTPLQKIKYICKEGVNEYKTKFAIFGFQYAEVDTNIEVSADDFTAYAVYSDMEQTGHFESSNALLNKFVDATVWSTKGNSADLPTDCPTRERHGWTGDAQIFFETAAYLFDYASFSKKYLRDVYDLQEKNGRLPQIAPYGGVDFYMKTLNGSVGWADAGILIPYRFYKIYGDEDILKEYYDRMKQYAGFMIRRCGKTGLMAKPIKIDKKYRKYLVNCGQSYGEWAEPADVYPNKWTDMVAPHTEVSTAYTSYVLGIMAEIAKLLGKKEDHDYFKKYSNGCKKAYQELVKTKEYSLDTDRQACLVRPLAFDLLNKDQRNYAKKRLVKALEHYGWRLGTGFLSTPLILDVLADINIDYAYRLLENEKMPGWLFMPKNGATTIWESWEGTQAQGGIASLNHYSKGAVCEWLFRTMCGIHVDGENHFAIAPKPGGHFTFAQAEYNSIFGKVKSAWTIKNGKTVYEIEIPANTSADILLPNGNKETVTAGKYSFEN